MLSASRNVKEKKLKNSIPFLTFPGAVLFAFLLYAPSASAAAPGGSLGCYGCDSWWTATGHTQARCFQVANNSWGDGLTCKLVYFLEFEDCEFYGGVCYYIVVNGRAAPISGPRSASRTGSGALRPTVYLF